MTITEKIRRAYFSVVYVRPHYPEGTERMAVRPFNLPGGKKESAHGKVVDVSALPGLDSIPPTQEGRPDSQPVHHQCAEEGDCPPDSTRRLYEGGQRRVS